MEGLNDVENDDGLDNGMQNDDWNEEADNGQMDNADEEEESINDEQGEDIINEDNFPLYPGALVTFLSDHDVIISFQYMA